VTPGGHAYGASTTTGIRQGPRRNAVYHAPRWQVVAGMKDLFEQLAIAADEARAVAGDLDD
jgi:hypothetical protein